ncbi:hypothetical protein EVAR_42850_1 [Eumeta japonica]|uniref:Uncharacterized protein n=1 Tax=Eumeta variegata TaxID=151549 RepID=A0A4C1WIJ7_EUMVA|nr:hypothetical protein EVAR_42850_1 [Eumeta japonica]
MFKGFKDVVYGEVSFYMGVEGELTWAPHALWALQKSCFLCSDIPNRLPVKGGFQEKGLKAANALVALLGLRISMGVDERFSLW